MTFHLRGLNKKKKQIIKKIFEEFENGHPEMEDAFIEVCTSNALLIKMLSDQKWPNYADGSGVDMLNVENETWVFSIQKEAIGEDVSMEAKASIYHFLSQIHFIVRNRELLKKYEEYIKDDGLIKKAEGFAFTECAEMMWKEFSIFSSNDFRFYGYENSNPQQLVGEFVRALMRDGQSLQAFDDMLVETSVLLAICQVARYSTDDVACLLPEGYRKFFLRMRDIFYTGLGYGTLASTHDSITKYYKELHNKKESA